MSESAVMALPADPMSARLAREHVMALVGAVATPAQCAIVEVVVSELVTNAVIHAYEPIRLSLDLNAETLRVGVSDGAPTATAVVPRQQWAGVGGRGLRIVEALASCWGVTEDDEGKTVWATVPLRSSESRM